MKRRVRTKEKKFKPERQYNNSDNGLEAWSR